MVSGEIRVWVSEFAHHLSEYLDKLRYGHLSKITLVKYNKQIAIVVPACSGTASFGGKR